MSSFGTPGMLIEMHLARILIRESSSAQIIELRESHPLHGEPRAFPIVIGIAEAVAIDRRLSGMDIGRPMTHDLLAHTIEALGASLESIAITHIDEGTFYATLVLSDRDGKRVEIDARPSDAIALGIAGDAPIYVSDDVIENAIMPPLDESE
ncbi:MAG: bifunctional nuclease family protein [Phycisphaerales bacterium]